MTTVTFGSVQPQAQETVITTATTSKIKNLQDVVNLCDIQNLDSTDVLDKLCDELLTKELRVKELTNRIKDIKNTLREYNKLMNSDKRTKENAIQFRTHGFYVNKDSKSLIVDIEKLDKFFTKHGFNVNDVKKDSTSRGAVKAF